MRQFSVKSNFVTHLLERETDLIYIQELLGYANLKTTEIYTHIAKKELDKTINLLDNLIKPETLLC